MIHHGDALEVLRTFESESIDCCITSPPYFLLRDYGIKKQLGHERLYDDYIIKLVTIFQEVNRVLKKTGSCWVVIGDTYENKGLLMIPYRFAIEMSRWGWILRNDIIWHKPNATPSSAKDRFTRDYELVFFFVKSHEYYFETQYEPMIEKYRNRYNIPFGGTNHKSGQGAFDYSKPRYIKPDPRGRIKRSVWNIPTETHSSMHFAVFPEKLVDIIIKSSCPPNGIVLDPFMGSGSTGIVALKNTRKFIGIELNNDYIKIAEDRLKQYQQVLI